ncbi:hypothetical protein ACFX2I_024618 [Malus domestica]
MDFFKVKKFRKAHKPDPENVSEDSPVPQPEEPNKKNSGDDFGKSANADPVAEAEDDDDDFIIEEVKRKLKELRRNSFMELIPEEESLPEEEEEEEAGETSSNEWRDVEAEGQLRWCGFVAVYDKYWERMLFFEQMSAQHLSGTGKRCIQTPTAPSPRSASKKLTSPFHCLSLKKIEEPDNETEHLQPPDDDPYQDIETSYVGQICLSWEALHCQYTQLNQLIACQPENPNSYNHSAQQFQQFQVLLQRYIENEPFEEGHRAEIYARTQRLLPNLLRVPNIQGPIQKGKEEEESDSSVHAPDLIKIIETSILTFQLFLKMDKKKPSSVLNLFGNQNQAATPLQQIQTSLQKKWMKLKELRKKRKGWKKKLWPQSQEDVQLLFSLIDAKVLSRTLRMVRISKEQLFWCEEKMKKLDLVDGKLWRDLSPTLFPCQ